jgi:hypothetical protein
LQIPNYEELDDYTDKKISFLIKNFKAIKEKTLLIRKIIEENKI